MRKLKAPVILLAIALLGAAIWRFRHAPLTDEEQILAAMQGIQSGAKNRSPREIANHLAKDFKIGELSKSEFQNSLAGGILQYRVIDLALNNPKVVVGGEKATSSGSYVLSLKSEYNSPPEITRGQFTLQWRKVDGEWLVSSGEADTPLQS